MNLIQLYLLLLEESDFRKGMFHALLSSKVQTVGLVIIKVTRGGLDFTLLSATNSTCFTPHTDLLPSTSFTALWVTVHYDFDLRYSWVCYKPKPNKESSFNYKVTNIYPVQILVLRYSKSICFWRGGGINDRRKIWAKGGDMLFTLLSL